MSMDTLIGRHQQNMLYIKASHEINLIIVFIKLYVIPVIDIQLRLVL